MDILVALVILTGALVTWCIVARIVYLVRKLAKGVSK